MDIVSIVVGAAGVGLFYFLYLAATKGLPAALAWVKTKWTAGKTALDALGTDLDSAHARIDALESGLKSVMADIANLRQRPGNTTPLATPLPLGIAIPVPAAPPLTAAVAAAAAPIAALGS